MDRKALTQNKEVVALPITKPSIITYLHHAYPLAIAQTDRRSSAYLAGSFLQLYTRMGTDRKTLNIDFYAYNGYYPECNFLNKIYETKESLSQFGATRVEQICAMLNSGFYVEALLDEYWLPNKAAYKKFSFLHQNLIYGYNFAERIFLAQGFTIDGQYANFTIDFKLLAKASQDIDRVRRYALKADNQGEGLEFDPVKTRSYLQDFIDSRCSVGAVDPIRRGTVLQEKVTRMAALKGILTRIPPPRKAYGLNTYDIATELVGYKNGRSIDMRPWCLFYEHKQNVVRLVQYLESVRRVTVHADLLREVKRLAADFLSVRNTLLESLLMDKKIKVSILESNLYRLANVEKKILPILIETVQ